MIKPTCLIFSHKEDEHLGPVLNEIGSQEVPFLIDLRDFGHHFSLTVEAPHSPGYVRLQSGEVVDFQNLKSVWWRRPTEYSIADHIPPELRSFILHERNFLIDGFLARLPSHVRMYNAPYAQYRFNSKLLQLSLARRCGLNIPKTCVTSDPSAAREFLEGVPRAIFKSFWGTREFWQPTRLTSDVSPDSFDHLIVCPTIFQEYIDGIMDIRVIVIDDAVEAAAFDLSQSRYPIDVRVDTRLSASTYHLNEEIAAKLKAFMSAAGLRFGAFDLRQKEDGTLVFFEINPMGQFLYLDRLAGTKVARLLATALTETSMDRIQEQAVAPDNDGWLDAERVPFAALAPPIKHLID